MPTVLPVVKNFFSPLWRKLLIIDFPYQCSPIVSCNASRYKQDGVRAIDVQQVAKSQFKARALELFRKIEESGSSVVVTDKGRPIVEVRRYRMNHRSPLEVLRNSVADFKRPTEPV